MISLHVHVPVHKVREHLDFIRENRLNLEIYFSAEALDDITTDSITAVMREFDHSPSLSIHAPFMDLSPGAVDAKVRDVTMHRFSQILDIAEVLRPKAIVFHSGYEKWRYALKMDWWLEKSLLTWQPLNQRARDLGVKIAIENIFEDDPVNLKMLMEHMNSDNFGICFDTGHFHLFSRAPLSDWLDALNPYIVELHLHDNDKTSDQHLPVGEGTFDFKCFFHLLGGKDCIYTIEAHSPEKVLKSAENIRRLTAS